MDNFRFVEEKKMNVKGVKIEEFFARMALNSGVKAFINWHDREIQFRLDEDSPPPINPHHWEECKLGSWEPVLSCHEREKEAEEAGP